MTTWLEDGNSGSAATRPAGKARAGHHRRVFPGPYILPAVRRGRLVKAVQRGCGISVEDARRLISRPMLLPLELRRGLTYADAMIGHYELLACDATALILPDGVVLDPPPGYLADLCAFFRKIPEFQLVSIQVEFLPSTEEAREFIDHFLGGVEPETFARRKVLRKKAQWMIRLAAKIGGRVVIYETT